MEQNIIDATGEYIDMVAQEVADKENYKNIIEKTKEYLNEVKVESAIKEVEVVLNKEQIQHLEDILNDKL